MSRCGFAFRAVAVAAPLSGMLPGVPGAILPGGSALADGIPPVAWSRQIGTIGSDYGYDVTVDGAGNVIITGEAATTLGGPGFGSPDAFVFKYDAAGNVLWSRQIGTSSVDTGSSVAADAAGNIFVAGTTAGGLDGASAGGRDAFLTKYDADGGVQWTRQVGTSTDDYGQSVKTDAAGNVYLTGYTGGTLGTGGGGGTTDAYIRKYDTAGNLLWARQFGTQHSDFAYGMTVDTSGNVLATGYTVGNLGGSDAGSNEGYVRKYDADGNVLWTRQFGTSGADEGQSITADTAGNVYVTGYTQGSLGGTHQGGFDAYLRKYDADGNVLWTRQLGNANAQIGWTVSVDGAGNVFIAGSTSGVLGEESFGNTDTFVAKYDVDGNLLWTHQLGTAGTDVGRGLWVDATGNVIYLVGYAGGELAGPYVNVFPSTTDVYLFKFAVPEPASLTLLLGGAAMMMRRRRLA